MIKLIIYLLMEYEITINDKNEYNKYSFFNKMVEFVSGDGAVCYFDVETNIITKVYYIDGDPLNNCLHNLRVVRVSAQDEPNTLLEGIREYQERMQTGEVGSYACLYALGIVG